MNVVLYSDEDMEPITVLDLPLELLKLGYEQGFVAVAVMQSVPFKPVGPDEAVAEYKRWDMRIFFERLRRRGRDVWLLTTPDYELALMAVASYLPGQAGQVRKLERMNKSLGEALGRALMLSLRP